MYMYMHAYIYVIDIDVKTDIDIYIYIYIYIFPLILGLGLLRFKVSGRHGQLVLRPPTTNSQSRDSRGSEVPGIGGYPTKSRKLASKNSRALPLGGLPH